MKAKSGFTFVCAVLLLLFAQSAYAGDEWKFGIGTGFFALNLDGDIGLTTASGTVILDMDLDNSDISDLTESAFGLGGFAAKDKWKIYYSGVQLELEGDGAGTVMGVPVSLEANFKVIHGDLGGVYNFLETERNTLGVRFGVDYTSHEFESEAVVGPMPLDREFDHDWIDGVVGVDHEFGFSQKFSWATRAHAAFGESEGTYLFHTGIDWHVAKSWVLNLYGEIKAVEFENDDPGDPDYYLYDVDEFGVGFSFAYIF